MTRNSNFILNFYDKNVTLVLAGGKGLNLALLARSNFNVPRGFIISTSVYEKYAKDNNLEEFIDKCLKDAPMDDFSSLEELSITIRSRFHEGILDSQILDSVYSAYDKMGCPPVSVRSSATAEDLADLSFAGQHDTILNVIDKESLKSAIVKCLSSLWTSRALHYRERNNIDHKGLALAVIVQEMIPSDIAGVMFTANPLTGKRAEYVIDSTFGLGEALVSGQIEPDHYIIDVPSGRIRHKTLGSKSIVITCQQGGGTVKTKEKSHNTETLSKENVSELVKLGMKITDYYESPQDIEWAFVKDELFVLQSRPITSLYPLPSEFLSKSKRVCLSLATVQGLLDPITPLGQDNLIFFLLGIPKGFGYKPSFDNQKVIWSAGERLWIDMAFPLRNRVMNRALLKVLFALDRPTQQIFEQITHDPWLSLRKRPHFTAFRRGFRMALYLLSSVSSFAFKPRRTRIEKQGFVEAALRAIELQSVRLPSLQERVAYYKKIADLTANIVLLTILPAIPIGYGPIFIARHLASSMLDDGSLGFELTRSLPNNPTTKMNLELGNTAEKLKADKQSIKAFLNSSEEELAAQFHQNQLPQTAQKALTAFLEEYGMRGYGEIDIGVPRWQDNPIPIIKTLKNYITLPYDQMPAAQFDQGKNAAKKAYNQLFSHAKETKGGKIKAKGLRIGVGRLRELAGLREYPKFSIVRIFGIIRKMLLVSGKELVEAGTFEKPTDIFFLHFRELEKLANGIENDWKTLVRTRREVYEREKQRKILPRVILSDGRTYYDGGDQIVEGTNVLYGSPVSPGVVEGVARIVLDPHKSKLETNEILVCPATDPSWTPLFLVARGLVMEVGGMMVHGAVVAREHNIPAVVSVVKATTIIQTGQRLRVNGTTGQVVILDA
ncbi:MAG: PEP/pyruvate-binding domain-containing protein [Candidatus Heimdallarchaeota archaeon]